MWNYLFDAMLRDFVRSGRLTATLPDGTTKSYGPGDGPDVTVTVKDDETLRRLVLKTEMEVGEAYMDGRLTIGGDDLESFMQLISINAGMTDDQWWRRLMGRLRALRRRIDQWNPAPRAKSNVAHHYDLSSDLYDLFLDDDRQYSCAYFPHPGMSLEAAQAAKKAHIAHKLLLRPDMEVFDIGCGWGGLAITLAREYGVRVLGVTLSEEQHRYATRRAEAEGLADRVKFELRDYRSVNRRFDRVVSVGMFEHVGVPHYDEYFDHVRDRLNDDGIALIHTIGRAGPPGATSPWIAKYIFPGGYVPALSEMSAAIERSGLVSTDIEVWRLHYAETLRHWYDRFEARQDEARALYDDRFCRMWRYYLKASEHSFRHRGQVVFQAQLARHVDAVPLSRDYLYPSPEPMRLSAAE
ncbi:methyltransferase domain-containing protein [Rhodobacterales bacterium HKCCE3408]|nr:methyltransferase domain-containing protein [Rhodobacterales bacterium HKCCE3408]